MMMPEYLLHFNSVGAVTVEVKDATGSSLPIRKMAMESCHLDRLIDPESGGFITRMTFDETLYEVSKFEIRPLESKLVIWVFEPIS